MTDHLRPNWPRSALILIDVQNDFLDGAAPVAGTAELVPAMAALAAAFRTAGRPVIHVVRAYLPGGSDVDLIRRSAIEAGAELVAPGSAGAGIPAALLPRDGITLDWDRLLAGEAQRIDDDEYVLHKPRWSAFHRTRLDELLAEHGVDTVVVAGCNLPNCPRATLFDASERDHRTVLVTDATSQTTPERSADAELIGVRLLTGADVAAALAP
ncbi:MAG: isochorismatase family cysteine hydrolase [Gordonia sp. (in: high G+C Gram-positive bacteria)]|uniref:cysteine hydrolase family protein n=1 Tax=Gordonia sp. (in: high G+C Gram-positive bacteria) TaxID=84139 RepID=UPI0039E2EB18